MPIMKTNPNDVTMGSLVTLKDASKFSWGKFHKGMIGEVTRKNKNPETKEIVYSVEVAGFGEYTCLRQDFKLQEEKVHANSALTTFFNKQKERMEEELKGVQDTVTDLERHKEDLSSGQVSALLQNKKRAKTLKRAMTCLVTPDTNVFKMARERLDRIRFYENSVVFVTKPIKVRHTVQHNSGSSIVYFPIGKFKVKCDFAQRATYFTPDDPAGQKDQPHNIRSSGRYHPHLSSRNTDASACWGNYFPHVARCYRTFDVSGLISVVIDFLEHCYERGWYSSIFGFMSPEAREQLEELGVEVCRDCGNVYDECRCDWCSDCDHPQDECTCNWCSDCEQHTDDCDCVRCPSSGEVLEENMFPDNQCARCTSLCRDIDEDEWRCIYSGVGNYVWSRDLEEYAPPTENGARYCTIHNHMCIPHRNVGGEPQSVTR